MFLGQRFEWFSIFEFPKNNLFFLSNDKIESGKSSNDFFAISIDNKDSDEKTG